MGSREPGLIKYGRWGIMFCFQGVGGLFLLFSGRGNALGPAPQICVRHGEMGELT